MIQKGLAAYIKEQLRNGYNIETIRQAILTQGYSHTDTEDTINSVIGRPATPIQPKETAHKKLGFFQKSETVLFHPRSFFSEVKTEGIRPSVIYLLTITFFFMLFFSAAIIVAAIQLNPDALNVQTLTIVTISLSIAFIFIYISLLIWILLESAFTQSIAKLLGGKGSYADCVKAMTYSLTPVWLFMIMLAIVVVPTIMFLPDFFDLKGLSEQPPNAGSLGIAGLFFGVVIIIAGIWSLIINLKGLGILHGKNAWWGLAVLVLRTVIEIIIDTMLGILFTLLIGSFVTMLLAAAISAASSGSIQLPFA